MTTRKPPARSARGAQRRRAGGAADRIESPSAPAPDDNARGQDEELGEPEEELEHDEPNDDELDSDEGAGVDREAIEMAIDPADDETDLETPEVSTALAPTTSASTTRSLAVRDPLQAYINETRRHPLLTPEQEHTLAVRYHEDGDLDAARQLVTSNLRLVIKIAHEYRKAYRNVLDLIQEGNVGLMHAVKKFNPYRGVKLSSYAAWWIRAYMLKFILSNWRMVKIGTTQNQRKLFFNLRREIEALQRMGIDDPGPKLLAERLDVSEQEVETMRKRLAGSDISLDVPLHPEEPGTSRLDMVVEHTAGPDRQVEDREFSELLRERVAEFGQTLSGREREIFELRTIADEPATLQEIGDRYGITRERARQIERRLMDRLRDYLHAELGDAVHVALGLSEQEEG